MDIHFHKRKYDNDGEPAGCEESILYSAEGLPNEGGWDSYLPAFTAAAGATGIPATELVGQVIVKGRRVAWILNDHTWADDHVYKLAL